MHLRPRVSAYEVQYFITAFIKEEDFSENLSFK